ncbi:MAG TPA: hypothetical protein VH559_11605 [Gemmatimonadaceae bacterium]
MCSLSSGRFAPCQARLSPLFNSEALYSEALYSEALYSEALYSEALYSEALNSERQRALYTSHQRAPASAQLAPPSRRN